jgi:hypothetical protein
LHEFSTCGKVYLVEKSEEEFQLWGLGIEIYMKQTVRVGWQHFCKAFIVSASIQPFPDSIICDLCFPANDLLQICRPALFMRFLSHPRMSTCLVFSCYPSLDTSQRTTISYSAINHNPYLFRDQMPNYGPQFCSYFTTSYRLLNCSPAVQSFVICCLTRLEIIEAWRTSKNITWQLDECWHSYRALHSIVLLGITLNASLCIFKDSPTSLSLGPACAEHIIINHKDRFVHAAATAYIILPVS